MDDVCNFIPPKKHTSDINYYHFVYETNIKKLNQPFSHANFYAYLVFRGSATLRTGQKDFPLERGSLFFTFPYQHHRFDDCDDFTFLYISFNGNGVATLLESLGITKENFLFPDFAHTIEFWMNSIRRVNRTNANTLTESVLMYTLSFIDGKDGAPVLKKGDNFDAIMEYIDHNYASKDISIKKIADIFFYSDKYLSSLFMKKTGVKFTHYLNEKRIKYAQRLIAGGNSNISDISFKCGFSDPFYFSKVFKKITGESPTAYMKK